jgi:hypothetical protein
VDGCQRPRKKKSSDRGSRSRETEMMTSRMVEKREINMMEVVAAAAARERARGGARK